MKIKKMPSNERPREKIIEKGVKYLSNSELIGVILESGYKEKSAVELGSSVINESDSGLLGLYNISIDELIKIKGIGIAKACKICSAIELGKRVNQENTNILGKAFIPMDVVRFFNNTFTDLNKEHFIILCLNSKNLITGYDIISIGILNSSLVHPREVFHSAIKKSASKIILIHNHPSGITDPSDQDDMITKRLKEVGDIIGINVVDHLIIVRDDYYSYKENSRI